VLELTEDQFYLGADSIMKIEMLRLKAGIGAMGAKPTKSYDASRDFDKMKKSPQLVFEERDG
jgi:hypothetical protein